MPYADTAAAAALATSPHRLPLGFPPAVPEVDLEAEGRARRLAVRVSSMAAAVDPRTGCRHVVGESAAWRRVLGEATLVAPTPATVLLRGESGTGKEVVARYVHRASARDGGPFVALNCAALPEHLLEAELFGYERGAFTGAMQSKPGQIERAAGGTLFLDEIGEMSLPAQAKLLRVLQEKEFQRLGSLRVLHTDARIIAATNRNLEQATATGQFREDLFYRLNVFPIHLPALRDRRDDIAPLCHELLTAICRGFGRPTARLDLDALQRLIAHAWPGNVRELRNTLERAVIVCEGERITASDIELDAARDGAMALAPVVAPVTAADAAEPVAPSGELPAIERSVIKQALEQARFNKVKAARALGLSRHQLYTRMRRHGLEAAEA